MLFRIGMFCFLCYLIACSTSKKVKDRVVINAGRSDSLTGLEIVKMSDCVTCHRIEGKLIAPSFTDIAKKYKLTADNIDKLSGKIIRGGNGVWGKLPMTPHTALAENDAKTIVKYILLLKK